MQYLWSIHRPVKVRGTTIGLRLSAARRVAMATRVVPWSLPLAVTVVLLDAVTKVSGWAWLPREGIALLPGVNLRVFINTRGPFGVGPVWIAILASLAALLAIARGYGERKRHVSTSLAWSLVFGGGCANVGERLLFGRTTDLVTLGERTAVNLADLAILFGSALLLWSWLYHRRAAQ